jgi:hypothetical protein
MAAEWYYTSNKQEMGPVSWQELVELAEAGILKASDKVWTEGMDDWIKAVNQKGLFGNEGGDDEGQIAAAGTKPSKKPAGPPPGRRARRDDDDEDDRDERKEAKRKAKEREEASVKTGIGIKIGLTLAGVLGLFLVAGCCIVGMVWLVFSPSAKVKDSYTLNNLGPRLHIDKAYTFTRGNKVVITSTNQTEFNNTDVDLFVFRGSNGQPNERPVVFDDRLPTPQDRNCRVEFVVPATDTYRIRVANLGPGVARSCVVNIEER